MMVIWVSLTPLIQNFHASHSRDVRPEFLFWGWIIVVCPLLVFIILVMMFYNILMPVYSMTVLTKVMMMMMAMTVKSFWKGQLAIILILRKPNTLTTSIKMFTMPNTECRSCFTLNQTSKAWYTKAATTVAKKSSRVVDVWGSWLRCDSGVEIASDKDGI